MRLKPPLEHDEQCAVVRWWQHQLPRVRLFAIPNGGHRHKAVAAKLKAEGVDSGVPDLFAPEWRLWVEMKRRGGRKPDPEQLDWHAYLRGCGYIVLVAYGASDAIAQITAFAKERGFL